MSYGISSDEVAEDFRLALEDLTMNSRYEISNLTVIAKENTENALAISEVLKEHIKRTAPVKKLPALYLLDSVVKNVGTPYTLFFGRNLYSTFMEAYALVDSNVRRKMEEMLKTWKEPVPGSLDTRPVFPVDVTRPIENALIKARTSAQQAHNEYIRNQQQPLRGRPGPSSMPYRETPTPPGMMRQPPYGQMPGPSGHPSQPAPYMQQPYGAPQPPQPIPRYSTPPVAVPSWQQPQQPQGYKALEDSIESLNSDIANLIASAKNEFAQNPFDGSIQTRLKALLDLQSILKSQKLPQDQITLIKDQVKQLSASFKSQAPKPAPVPAPAPVAVPQPPPQQTLASLLGDPNALAALLAKATAAQKVPTPPPQSTQPVRRSPQQYIPQPYPPAPPKSAQSAVPNPVNLLDQLRAAGLLRGASSTRNTPPIPPLPLSGAFPPGFRPPVPPPATPTPNAWSSMVNASNIPNDVQLKSVSLKIPRPHLISQLYERRGAPCTQCGRRFQSDEEGKKKKTAHMDWHFRVHQRMAEAEKRGQHRSWYVDELDWIKSRETEDDHLAAATNGNAAADKDAALKAKSPKLQYLPVPDDPALANSLCPICQEKFEMKWLDDAQEFVWMDAVKIGDRIYHASCHSEAKRDRGNTPSYQRGTPEPVLGKRKNEDDLVSFRTRIKMES